MTTSELDELAAETAASLTATHPDYALVRAACRAGSAAGEGGGQPSAAPPPAFCRPAAANRPQPPPPLPSLLQLAARIAVSNLHKNTLKSFSET